MSTEEKDKYDLLRDEKKQIVEQCQESKNVTTCMDCEALLGCETRKEYVLAVYESMSKGESGGFEF